jgi:hypothetical protein
MPSVITDENFGAWLLKSNPKEKYNLRAARDAGETIVDIWTVVNNVRSQSMRRGQKVILWVSGDGQLMTRGIWGVGRITEGLHGINPQPLKPGEISHWRDEKARLASTHIVEVNIPLFDEALSAAEIKAAGIVDLEVQKIAAGPNPSWVTKDQLARLEELLPEVAGDDAEQTIVVSPHGAGFGDPKQNAVVEAAGMAAVKKFYKGWSYRDVSDKKVGWDITFTHNKSGQVSKVEVKGVRGSKPIVLLTANEIRAAKKHSEWILAVVTHALTNPTVTEYEAAVVVAATKPYVFKANLT